MPSVDATPEAAAPPRAAISHVIFNMDGLLLDTEGFYTAVQEKILARYGKVFDWSVKAKMMGKTTAESTSILFEECGLTGLLTPEEFLKERETMLKELLPTSVAMPGRPRGSLKRSTLEKKRPFVSARLVPRSGARLLTDGSILAVH